MLVRVISGLAVLATVHRPVDQACFDVASPIVGGRAQLTDLPWQPTEGPAPARTLALLWVGLFNDRATCPGGMAACPGSWSFRPRCSEPLGLRAIMAYPADTASTS